MHLTFLLFSIHHHDLFLCNLLSYLLLIECHIVHGISSEASLHALIVWQNILFDDWIYLLGAAYLQLFLKVLCYIAHLLFHVIHKICLTVKIYLLIGYKLVQ